MTSVNANNKRIAKNTLMLYIRMIVVMLVTLYTSRVVLHALGAEDFGINNVVGGIVTMLSFLSNTMLHSAQRFFSIELGRENYDQLKKVFKVSITIYLLIGVASLILGETVGMWFLHRYMTIPAERMVAAEWVLHFAVLTFCFSIMVLPYKAAIMARENMSIMAYLSILEAIAKLAIVYLLVVSPVDKLISFAALTFAVNVIITVAYMLFARIKYEECRFGISTERKLFNEVMSFTGWSFMGHFATMIRSQGVNILLNVYCGPIVNAARALAFQVNTAVTNLYYNFFMAVKPQIIKYYSLENREEMFKLMIRGSKICYFLVFVISLPLLLETDFILGLWLKEVPEYTAIFVQLVLVNTLIEAVLAGLTTAIDATGDIKRYQSILTVILLASFFISWIVLCRGGAPFVPMIVIILLTFVRLVVQMYFVQKQISLKMSYFTKAVLVPMVLASFVSSILPCFLCKVMESGWLRLVVVLLVSCLGSMVFFWFIGVQKEERSALLNLFKKKFMKKDVCLTQE